MNDNIDVARIQADFDRLALLSREGWDHNSHYHRFILKQVPARSRNALEIGCGTGTFARLLARRVEHVLALDLSPQMIRLKNAQRHTQTSTFGWQMCYLWSFLLSSSIALSLLPPSIMCRWRRSSAK